MATSNLGDKVPATSYAATGLPAGLSISNTGIISGTPTALGAFTASITATNPNGTSATATLTGTVIDVPVLTATGLFSGFEKPALGDVNYARTPGVSPTLGNPTGEELSFTGTYPGTAPGTNKRLSLNVTAKTLTGTPPAYVVAIIKNDVDNAAEAANTPSSATPSAHCLEQHRLDNTAETPATSYRGRLTSEPIDTGTFTKFRASIEHRNVSTSASNFELSVPAPVAPATVPAAATTITGGDFVAVYLETAASLTGPWTQTADIIPYTTGISTPSSNVKDDVNGLNLDGTINGKWRKFETLDIDVTTANKYVRVVIDTASDSNSEYLYFDNLIVRGITSGLTDTDTDGLDDTWETLHFGNLTTANGTTDTDHDGQPDLAEFLSGTNPTDPKDSLHITNISYSIANHTGTVTAATVAGKTYQLQASDNLGGWASQGAPVPATGPSTDFPITAPLALENDIKKHFFRVILP
jgi:hypothetical protein